MQKPLTPSGTVKSESAKMLKRLGSTVYEVSVYFSETSRETVGDKIVRLIRGEAAHGKAAAE
jgi:hypothetical protein